MNFADTISIRMCMILSNKAMRYTVPAKRRSRNKSKGYDFQKTLLSTLPLCMISMQDNDFT